MAIIPKPDEIVDVVPLSTLVSMAAALEARNEAQRAELDKATRLLGVLMADPYLTVRQSEGDCWDCNLCDSGYWNHPANVVHKPECPTEQARAFLRKGE